jgi:hypothetical protein
MHLQPFKKQYHDYDFSAIHATIKEFHPIDSDKRLTAKNIAASPGFKKIGALIEDNFVNKKNYKARWKKLNEFLNAEIKKPVRDTVSLSNCCYSGVVILENSKTGDIIRSKALHFYISLLGPFFSIHGIDSSTIILPIDPRYGNDTGHFAATHAVMVSPAFEYESVFRSLEDKLKESFPGYSFVPYDVGMSTIKNISVEDDLRDLRLLDTVYEGLFGQVAVHNCTWRGDRNYGLRAWL